MLVPLDARPTGDKDMRMAIAGIGYENRDMFDFGDLRPENVTKFDFCLIFPALLRKSASLDFKPPGQSVA